MKRVLTATCFSLLASFAFSSTITGITADGEKEVFKIGAVESIKLSPQKAGDKGYPTILFGARGDAKVENVSAVQTIMVYPNPVSEYITIVGAEETDEVVVTDLQGAAVLRTKGARIEVSSLPQGGYLLSVQGKTVKFLKK